MHDDRLADRVAYLVEAGNGPRDMIATDGTIRDTRENDECGRRHANAARQMQRFDRSRQIIEPALELTDVCGPCCRRCEYPMRMTVRRTPATLCGNACRQARRPGGIQRLSEASSTIHWTSST